MDFKRDLFLFVCVCMCAWRPEGVIISPEAGVIGGCELPYSMMETKLQSSERTVKAPSPKS